MGNCRRCALPVVAALLLFPAAACAGMPSISLTDIAQMRIENISFFLAVLLLSAWFVKKLWNYLRKDWTFLPPLTYGKALGVMILWGLLFVLVLTMISGARELLTPGAWEKQGLTYKLAKDGGTAPSSPSDTSSDMVRFLKLDRLRSTLWKYAATHDGKFPPDRLRNPPGGVANGGPPRDALHLRAQPGRRPRCNAAGVRAGTRPAAAAGAAHQRRDPAHELGELGGGAGSGEQVMGKKNAAEEFPE